MNHRIPSTPLPIALLLACATATHAASEPAGDEIVVYGKKHPESLRRSAESVTVILGEELRLRGASTLAAALASVAGMQLAPGGDGGPASSVPALLGLREFDAFLLVVDGVPAGAAYTPTLTGLSLLGVERIEVIKGAAPVAYGATSFVGVINVVHRAAGDLQGEVAAGVGSRNGGRVSLLQPLATIGGGWRQSLMVEVEAQDLSAARSDHGTGHALYRGGGALGAGTLGLDIDLVSVEQRPSSPQPREGSQLSARFPQDANVNPSDARLDEDRASIATHAALPTRLGDWDTRLAFTRIEDRNLRGFLRADFAVDGVTSNADGYVQRVRRDEWYLDSHLATAPRAGLALVAGADLIAGDGEQRSRNFEYAVLPDGSNTPAHDTLPVDESTELANGRRIGGVYVDGSIELAPRWRAELGVRWNAVDDHQRGAAQPTGGSAQNDADSRSDTRWSGALKSSYLLWQDGADYLTLFGNWSDNFKPAVIDFGPEAEAELLRPEDVQGVELGLRTQLFAQRLKFEAMAFDKAFHDLVVAQAVNGLPAKLNGGDASLEGIELEATYLLLPGLRATATYALHEARFDDYQQLFGSTMQQLRDNYLE